MIWPPLNGPVWKVMPLNVPPAKSPGGRSPNVTSRSGGLTLLPPSSPMASPSPPSGPIWFVTGQAVIARSSVPTAKNPNASRTSIAGTLPRRGAKARRFRRQLEDPIRMQALRAFEQNLLGLDVVWIRNAALRRADGLAGLVRKESHALGAERGIDHVTVLAFANGVIRAFGDARVAEDAFVGDHRGHFNSPGPTRPSRARFALTSTSPRRGPAGTATRDVVPIRAPDASRPFAGRNVRSVAA